MNKNKLLFVFPYFPPYKGAASKRAYFMIKYLSKMAKSPIDVFITCNKGFVSFKERIKNVNIFYIEASCKARDFKGYFNLFFKFLQLIKKNSYKKVFISLPPSISGTILFLCSLFFTSTKIIVELRDIALEMVEATKGIRNIYYRFLWFVERLMVINKRTIVITVSNWLKKLIEFKCGKRINIYVVRNGTIPEYFNTSKNIKKTIDIIYVGRLTRYRRVEDIFKFLHELLKYGKFKIVFLSGKAEDYKPLGIKELLKKYSLEEKITFLPMVEYGEMMKYLKKSKIGLTAIPDRIFLKGAGGTKVYDYLTAGIPTVCIFNPSIHREIANILQEVGVMSVNVEHLAKSTLKLMENKKCFSCIKRVQKLYNFNEEVKKLYKIIMESNG